MPNYVANGSFEVKVSPLPTDPVVAETLIGRLSLEKVFAGDLVGTGRGIMLGVRTPVEGSAAYVAIEEVSGTMAGRTGTFVLQHHGTVADGNQELRVSVVRDSGTGGFAGIRGTLEILIEGKAHHYRLDCLFDQ